MPENYLKKLVVERLRSMPPNISFSFLVWANAVEPFNAKKVRK